MWIDQGKPTMAGHFRFVQLIDKMVVQFSGGFESAIYPPYRESIIRGLTKFLSVKIVEYEPQTR